MINQTKKNSSEDSVELTPLCEKCGNAMLKEDDVWVCPHCQGEIDFLGDEDE
jgi:rubrerythrin